MFRQALQFSCCSPEPVMGKTLSWQLQAGGISLAFLANNYAWIIKNAVDFEAKPFRLPATAGRAAFAAVLKARAASVKEGRGRKPGGVGTSCYHRLIRGPQELSHREWLFAQ